MIDGVTRKLSEERVRADQKKFKHVDSLTNKDAEGKQFQTFFTKDSTEMVYAFTDYHTPEVDYILKFFPESFKQ